MKPLLHARVVSTGVIVPVLANPDGTLQCDGGGGGGEVLSGSGTPGAGLGSNGDIYVDLNNGDLYRKFGGAWSIWAFLLAGFQFVCHMVLTLI